MVTFQFSGKGKTWDRFRSDVHRQPQGGLRVRFGNESVPGLAFLPLDFAEAVDLSQAGSGQSLPALLASLSKIC